MKSVFTKIVFLLLLQTGQFVAAQVKFSANLSPTQISKDEYTQLRLIVENAREVQEINPPVLNNFTIISGPNQESGMSMVNGEVTKYIAIGFIIKPRGPGTFIIPSTTARADGSLFRSAPVSLKVLNTVSGNNNMGGNGFNSPFNGIDPFAETVPEKAYQDFLLHKGEDALEKIRKNMMVKVVTDKASCFVGEPIVATYKLYTRLKSESAMTKNPSFNGFSVIDLLQPDNTNYKVEKINGRDYNVYTIRKAQLYPLQSGDLVLEPAEIDNNVHFIKSEYFNKQRDNAADIFGFFSDVAIPPEGVEDHKITLQSKPMSILVKPLPVSGKPADFKGAVGNFSIDATLSKKNFNTDEVSELSVIISGSGNLQLVTAPEINWPAGMDGFEPKITDDLYKTTVPVSGRKIISFPFSIDQPGEYTLPSVSLSYFDVKAARYRTVVTKPLSFKVIKGTGKRPENSLENPSLQESMLTRFFNNRWRVVSAVALLILCGLIFWLRREIKKDKPKLPALSPDTQKTETEVDAFAAMHLNIPENPLEEASGYLHKNDGTAFYPALNKALRDYLSHILHILPEELNKKTISEKLDNRGVRNDISLQLYRLLDEMEWQLYTPVTGYEKIQEMYDRANGLIQLLNRYKS